MQLMCYLPKNKRISPIKLLKISVRFAEMLKNKSFGQISLLKIKPINLEEIIS